MTALDLWGAVIPAWLGGVGGLAAAVVSTIALVKSLKTQGGVETLKEAANAAEAPAAMISETPPPTSERSPVSWTAWQQSKSAYRLRNDSTHTGASAMLTGFRDVTPGGDGAASYGGPLPVDLAAGESVPFTIEKSLVSPSVTAIELTWNDSDGTERKRTLYI